MVRVLNCAAMRPLGAEWRERHLRPELQKYLHCRFPEGYGIIYAFVKKFGDEKAYVGQCFDKKGFGNRLRTHTNSKNCAALSNAIECYGIDSFSIIVVDLLPIEELDDAEYEFIWQFKTLIPSGYNIREGGSGGGLTGESLEQMRKTVRSSEKREEARERKKRTWAKYTADEKAALSKTNSEAQLQPHVREKHSKSQAKKMCQLGEGGRAELFARQQETRMKTFQARYEAKRKKAVPDVPFGQRIPGVLYIGSDGVLKRCDKDGYTRRVHAKIQV
jgi:group I intron endonuclease